MSEFTERDIHTGPRGLRLRVRERGEGRPVVILHGFLEQAAAWDRVSQRLAGRVVAVDQRGHGLSEHIGRGGFYHFWDYLSDLQGIVDDLGGTVDLVGHSMGGTVASLFSGLRPDAVRRLVLVEGLGPPDGRNELPGRPRRFLSDMREPPRHPPVADIADGARRMQKFNALLTDDEAQRLASRVLRPLTPSDRVKGEPIDGGLIWTWDALHRARSPNPYSPPVHIAILRQITAPTLLVYGSRSWYPRLPGLGEREAAIADRERIVFPDVGHHPHHQCPDELSSVIRRHLEA